MKEERVNDILAIGTDLVLKKGYNNIGIQEVLDAANIPKGSFYYYFKSKEDFGIKLIKYYSKHSLSILNQYLVDMQKEPKERIISFFKDMRDVYTNNGFKEGCLLGNCSLELADLSETFSNAIATELNIWQEVFKKCITEGQSTGNIKSEQSAKDLANFLLTGWEGALLRMKSAKNDDSINVFIQFISEYIL